MKNERTLNNALSLALEIVALFNDQQTNEIVTLVMPNEAAWLSNKIESQKSRSFSIIVTGGFNSGKSTLINAIVENKVLHDGAIPTTTVITRLIRGTSFQAKLIYKSGEEELLDWNDYINQKNTSFDSKSILTLDIYIPHETLAAGVEIIDTPGLNEHEQRTRLVLDYLPNVDAIILVIDAMQPIRRDDLDFIHLIGRPPFENVFFVVNRMGKIKKAVDRDDVSEHIKTKLSSWLTKDKDSINGQYNYSNLFFVDAKAVVDSIGKDKINVKSDEFFDFYPFKQKLITFLDIEKREHVSMISLAQELTGVCYKIEQRLKLAEVAFSQPLTELQKKYANSQENIIAIQKAYDKIAFQLTKFGEELGEQIHTNLFLHIGDMQKNWLDDVKKFDLSSVEKLNITSVKISQREKNRLAEILSKTLKHYLDLKLLEWMRLLPNVITPVLENFSYRIRTDMTTIGLQLKELEASFSDSRNSLTQRQSSAEQPDMVLAPIRNLVDNIIKDIVKWPFLEDIESTFKHPDTLKIVGFSAIGALLAAGAALMGTNPIGIFVATLGAGLIQTLKTRHEQREYNKIMREESSSDKAFQSLGTDNISQFQRAVRSALNEEIGKYFFIEIEKQINDQKTKIITSVTVELQVIADRMKHTLDNQLTQIMDRHKQLLARKEAGEKAVENELIRLNQFNSIFRKLFNDFCQQVFGNPLSEKDIQEIGQAKANYLLDYAGFKEKKIEINVNQVIAPYGFSEVNSVSKHDSQGLSANALHKRTQTILSNVLGVTLSPDQLSPSIESAWTRLNKLVGIKNVKESVKELMDFQATQRRRKLEGGLVTNLHLHLVFSGNPGTGKTTVAKIIGELYRDLGLLKRGHTVEVKAKELIAGYVGQTSGKTYEKIKEALDGVLFIDEAYSLVPKNEIETNFGKDVIAELLGAMEEYSDRLVVIVAGYNDEIQHFLDFNPGLRERFPLDNHLIFQNYSPEELYEILIIFLSERELHLSETSDIATKEILKGYFEQKSHEKTFANARFVRGFAESLIIKVGARINRDSLPTNTPIELEDISDVYNHYRLKRGSQVEALLELKEIPSKERLSTLSSEGVRQKISDQDKVLKDAIINQIHRGTGDNVYGDKIVFEQPGKIINRELTLIPSFGGKTFFGHTKVMENIISRLSLKNRVLLQSIGGSGKTSLAISLINKYAQDFQHIAWLDCKTTVTQAFLESEELLKHIGISFNDNANENTRFRLLQSKLVDKIKQTTLIVIDNVNKTHEAELSKMSLSSNFKILLTSRERLEGFELIELPILPLDDAYSLFCRESGYKEEDLDQKVLQDLFHLVDYHAMAIETLAKQFSNSYGQSIDDFMAEIKLKNIGINLTELLQNIIDTTSLNVREQDLIRCFSVLPSAYIPHDVTQSLGFTEEDFNLSASILIKKGMLDEDKVLGFKCQQIIQDAIRTQLKPGIDNCKGMLESMGDKLTNRIEGLNYRQQHILASRFLPMLQSVVNHIGNEEAYFIPIFKNLGLFARILGDFEQAKTWIKRSIEAIKLLGNASPPKLYMEALQVYADICQARGDYDEAEDILSNHLQYLQKETPQALVEIGLGYEKLGMLYLRKGNLAEAIDSLREAVEVYGKLGEDNMTLEHTAQTNTNLGLAMINFGMPYEAKEILVEASNHYEKINNAIGLGFVYHYLSVAHIALGEFQKAHSLLLRAREYLVKELPEDELIFAEFNNNSTIITINSFLKEESSFDEKDIHGMVRNQISAIQILEHHRPEGHSDFALYYYNLAMLFNQLNDEGKTRQWASKSIGILEHNNEGEKNLILANFHFMMAIQLSNLLNYDEIETHLKRALEVLPDKEEYSGQRATFYLILGATYLDCKKYEYAEEHFKKSYEIYRQAFSEDHPTHAFSLHCLVTCLRMEGKYQEALIKQEEVLEICSHLMPDNDPDMAFPYSQMALIHSEMKNYREALYFRQKAVNANDGSTDLSDLNDLGHVGLFKYTNNQLFYFAYTVILPENQNKKIISKDENLIISQYDSLEKAINAQTSIESKFGSIKEFHIN